MFTRGPPKSATQRNPAGTPDGNGKWQLVNEDEKRRAFKNQLEKQHVRCQSMHILNIYTYYYIYTYRVMSLRYQKVGPRAGGDHIHIYIYNMYIYYIHVYMHMYIYIYK